MQGPAGVSTSFAPVEDESKALGDFEPGAIERPEGIVSPEGLLDGPDLEGTTEAEEAATRAHKRSDDPDDIMDALEAAEAKYDKAHPEEAAGNTGGAPAEAKAKGPGKKGPLVSASASGSPGVPAHASKGIDQEIRDHAQSRIKAALQDNNHVQKSSINRAAMDVEQRCYNRATESDNARTIYHNLMANATRLAKSEKDVQDIARIAAGEPDKVAKGEMTKGQQAGDVAAGLQGFVDKPRHAVG
ncbi:MAG: hypothetical protein FRX49_06075 [Trebouxia sp. A1-2]|nr:MAG: hypothetical protein FRX49_06075 [Trebouxia sp. A1-2]